MLSYEMMENKEIALKKAVSIFLKELLGLQKDEKFLIYADTHQEDSLVKVIEDCAQEMGALVEEYRAQPSNDAVKELTAKVRQNKYDAICELTEQTLYQTPLWPEASGLGTRIYSLTGVDADAFLRYIGAVNHKLMSESGWALRDILRTAKTIKITTPAGTNISLRMRLGLAFRALRRLLKRPGTFVVEPSGIATKRGQSTFAGGQLAFQGVLESINGTAVIDGYLWPPKEIGCLNSPVVLKIKKGKVVEISGNHTKSEILQKWFGKIQPGIEHFCIGFNPKATFSGSLMEAERVFGSMTMGVGRYPLHVDGVMVNPTVLVDGKTIEQNGAFIDTRLSEIEKN